MPSRIFEEMKSYVGFGQRDAELLRSLAKPLAPDLHKVVDRFYEEALRHPETRAVLADLPEGLQTLRPHLHNWLTTLFCGTYDEQYVEMRAAIGRSHVRVALPQHYMITALEIVRIELREMIRAADVPDTNEKLTALNRLLALEAGIMFESYKASYAAQVRELERVTMRDRLSRAEHLAEFGELAASLAHEVKNPLAGISGAIQVIRDGMKTDDAHRPILDEILRQVGRLDGTVKDLLTYARPQEPRFKTCDLRMVIGHVTSLVTQQPMFQGVRLECDATTETLDADEHQIEQLLVNLLLNAAHASKHHDAVRLRVAPNESEIALIVEDHGQGMDEDARRRAFEPFFTTKTRGTGLGLPICHRIVESHGGTIIIHSEVGRGTAVEVRLPRRHATSDNGATP